MPNKLLKAFLKDSGLHNFKINGIKQQITKRIYKAIESITELTFKKIVEKILKNTEKYTHVITLRVLKEIKKKNTRGFFFFFLCAF